MRNGRPPWAGTDSPMADNDRGADWIQDREVETAPPDQIHALADAAWQLQRRHVAANSAFYKTRGAADSAIDAVDLDGLSGLPFTTKQQLQTSQDEAPPFGSHLAVSESAVARRYETSGTAGHPTVIALADDDLDAWMQIGLRSYTTAGVRPHNIVLSTFDPEPFVVGFTHEVIERIGATLLTPGARNLDGAMSALASGGVDTLLSTPSTTVYLLDRLEKADVDPGAMGLIHLILGGEPGAGPGPMRAKLERAFGAVVTEAMGLGDIAPSLFAECPAQRGMHFSASGLVWPELIDGETGEPRPIEEGAEGEMVYTHLKREAMPLVRFRSRDRVRIGTMRCPCGRSSFTVRAVGRADDMVVVRGVNVYPSAVQAVVADVTPLATGRVRLVRPEDNDRDSPLRVDVEVSRGSVGGEDPAAVIERALHERLRFRAVVALLTPEDFGSAHYKTPLVTEGDSQAG